MVKPDGRNLRNALDEVRVSHQDGQISVVVVVVPVRPTASASPFGPLVRGVNGVERELDLVG